MKWGKLFLPVMFLCLGVACSDSDSKDDDDKTLDMSDVVDRCLYYNKWLNNKDAYTMEGLVDMIRLGRDGKLWEIDFGGRNEKYMGTWKEITSENQLQISYEDGERETWHVLSWEKGVFTVMVNKGKREYIAEDNSKVDYLKNITGDAFFFSEVTQTESKTSLRVLIEGTNTVEVREAKVILSDDQSMEMKYIGNKTWSEKEEIGESALKDLGMPAKSRDVIFYVNMGSDKQFKFADHVYSEAFGKVDYDDFELRASNTSAEIKVRWNNPYSGNNAYYQIEILSEDKGTTYFKSDYLNKGTTELSIDNTTKTMLGTTNDIRKLIDKGTGTKFRVRLSAVLLEPAISYTSTSSYTNRQAVTDVTVLQVLN